MVVCIMLSRYLCLTFTCLGVKYFSLGVYFVLFYICCGCVCLLCVECYVNHLVMLRAFGFSTCLLFMCYKFVAWQFCCFVICLSCAFKINVWFIYVKYCVSTIYYMSYMAHIWCGFMFFLFFMCIACLMCFLYYVCLCVLCFQSPICW
jgi:hypothetical protein